MINIYKEEDLISAKKQKKTILTWFFVTLSILLIINIGVFIFYVFQEYHTKWRGWLLAFNIVSCSIYAIIYMIIFSIKYKRVRDYVRLLLGVKNGLVSEGTNTYVRTDSSITVKDGVDFINLVFLQWSDKKQEYFERNILCDLEKPIPDFKKGDVVHHITHGNVLISYELTSQDIFE